MTVVMPLSMKLVEVLRGVGGNIDADLIQRGDGGGVDVAGGVRPGAVDFDEVAGGFSQDTLGHVASAGVSGAEDEDFLLHNVCWRNGRMVEAQAFGSDSSFVSRDPAEPGVFGETEGFPGAVLEAFEIFLQKRAARFGDSVNHPLRDTLALDQPQILHIPELFRNFHLIRSEDFHQMADAKRPVFQEIQDAEALLIAQALVDIDDFHAAVYARFRIFCQWK